MKVWRKAAERINRLREAGDEIPKARDQMRVYLKLLHQKPASNWLLGGLLQRGGYARAD